MTEKRVFTDEDLTAYLDGEVDAATGSAIEKALASDDVLSKRLTKLRFSTRALRDAFDGLVAAAPPAPHLPELTQSTSRRSLHRLALAGSLVLGVAFGASLTSWRAQDPYGWMDYVAAYQALYVNETLVSVSETQEQSAASLAALGTTLGLDLSNAQSDSALQFKRGQLLGYQGNALVQLAYLSPAGDPVALCIIQRKAEEASDVTLTNLEGMAAAHWQKDGFAFLLIGGTDTGLIEDAAQRMAGAI